MRLEQMTVHLRARSAGEAVELGTALVRRHAAAIWKPWVLVTLPLFVAFNAAAWAVDAIWLAWLLMWWLKPAFDRIPLFVISRATFGAAPSLRDTLQAQLRWGWKPLLHYLSWRRFGFVRSLYLPIDLLEGVQGARAGSRPGQALSERRRVLGGTVYGNAVLLSLVCLHFEASLVLGGIALIFLFVPVESLPETLRAGWSLISSQPPWWAQVGFNGFAWLAVSLVEPFFVGAGFGLYLNRRTEIEAWDVEIAFRKLRTRLAGLAAPLAVVLALIGAGLGPVHAQQTEPPARPAKADARQPRIAEPTLPRVFGDARVDSRNFSKAVDRAYLDPLLNARRTQVTWEKKDKAKPVPAKRQDLSWLAGFDAMFAFVAEWGLWILAAGLVLMLLLTLRHWLPWMRGALQRHRPLPAEVETEALQLPENLPDDIPAAARRLWAEGRPRHALALLYRASVEAMAVRANVALPPGATESECLRASRRRPNETDRSLFARMVRVWQYAAYAGQLPVQDDFEALVGTLQQQFRWQA